MAPAAFVNRSTCQIIISYMLLQGTMYNATIKFPKGVEITVKPTSLIFSHTLQKKSFKVVVKAKSMTSMKIVSGSLVC
jgi:hypothetical protein